MSDSLGDALTGSTVTMICLTTLVISVRIGVRASLRTFGIDDVLVTASWLFTMGMSAHAGFGRHQQDIGPEEQERILKACPQIKLRRLVILNKAIVVFLCCQAIEESLIPIFQCHPISKAWKPETPGRCIDLPVLWWCGFAFNLCTDLILFIQPVPTLWKLQLPIIKRLGLIAMLSLGLMVCAISIIRMHSVTKMGVDGIHDLVIPIIWSEAEDR
ncbi:hypothetical protein Cob_v012962 [Colletotrichum orbiculare MAFF 240422]|uniref:Rhodopsin domain-containing protein n=1 Tax=Colletotrichum orbiculare (strain 104-T / ATCC 96160 / CBS 514.97 / LARS 414 / MAFF 240422) TaxID=1213857 RepID=A0A484F798_COLOR|nr:hypothetical protein Cob_v012962 [Colletotrichum orbiculare MAFF 240422]